MRQSQDVEDEWERGKREHILLSEEAADLYDDEYESANFATSSYMNYELRELERLARAVPEKHIAVDLGCGTGRHSFMLADQFAMVFGYDISPAMITNAERAKAARGIGNVRFEVVDVEVDVPSIGQGKADLVSCSFGMGSFIRDLPTLFKTVKMLLKPGGLVAFSWYNADALVNSLELPWQPALAARMVPGRRLLRVEFAGSVRDISARAYGVSEVRKELASNFGDIEITTYPTLTALFPQELFEQVRAQELCRAVDEQLKHETSGHAAGPYIFATARKRGRHQEQKRLGIAAVEEALRLLGIHPTRFDHAPLRSIDDVRREFPEVPPGALIKSVVFGRCRPDGQGGFAASDPAHDDLLLCLVGGDTGVDQSALADYLHLGRKHLYLLSGLHLEERTGFEIGAIPPFGMPERVQTIIDRRLLDQRTVYMGSGRVTSTYRMTLDDLLNLSTASTADISRG